MTLRKRKSLQKRKRNQVNHREINSSRYRRRTSKKDSSLLQIEKG